MFTLVCSLLLNVAMATCSQQVSGNFISLPSGSSQGESVGCWLGPPFTVTREETTKPVVRLDEELEERGLWLSEMVVYWSIVPSVSWTTAVWVSGLVQRVRATPGRGRE